MFKMHIINDKSFQRYSWISSAWTGSLVPGILYQSWKQKKEIK